VRLGELATNGTPCGFLNRKLISLAMPNEAVIGFFTLRTLMREHLLDRVIADGWAPHCHMFLDWVKRVALA
jgi:hypothetical protein